MPKDDPDVTVNDIGLTDESVLRIKEIHEPCQMTLQIHMLDGTKHFVTVNQLATGEDVCDRIGVSVDNARLLFAGKQLDLNRRLRDYNIMDGSRLHNVLRLTGGKPVIYLYTPQGETFQNVQVKVTLDSDKWNFDALHPAPIHRTDTECEWLGKKVTYHIIIHRDFACVIIGLGVQWYLILDES